MIETDTSKIETKKDNDSKKTFELYNLETGQVVGVFTGKAPRQAALKAAAKGVTDIVLRPRGSAKPKDGIVALLYRYRGTKVQKQWPMPYPEWMVKSLKVPPEENKKGNEAKYPYLYPSPIVKRVNYYKVPAVEEQSRVVVVEAFVKALSK